MRTKSSNHTKKRPLVLLLAAVLVIAAAVGAYAYWTSDGSGTGTGTTGETDAIVINQTSVVTDMGPGVAPQDLAGDFTNDNADPVFVGSVEAVVAETGLPAGCTSADYVIAGAPMTVNAEVVTGDEWAGATIAFDNDPLVNQDACQGATVTIDYTASETVPAP